MVRVLFLLLVFGLNARASDDFCRLMLESGEAKNVELNARVLGHLQEKLALAKATRQFSFIQDMHEVTEKLIAENTINRDQADVLLAEQLLGRYESIFRTYVVAELRVRGFSPDEIVQFLVHFDEAFSAGEQVMFALDVARRMLMTINEETGTHTSRPLKKFLDTARSFNLPTDTYSSFLQLWAHIRSAEPSTIVHYILSNIKNSGNAIREQTTRALQAAEASPREPERTWGRFLENLLNDRTYAPTFESVAQTFLAIDSVPKDLLNVPGLGKTFGPAPSFASLYRATDSADVRSSIEKLESFPPFAHAYIFEKELPSMSREVLFRLPQTRFYQNLPPEVRTLADPRRAKFEELRQLEEQLHAIARRVHEPNLSIILTGTLPKTVLQQFEKTLDNCMQHADMPARREQKETFACVEGAYLEVCRTHNGKIQVADFMEIVMSTMKRIFPQTVERSIGAAQALQKCSKDFVLTSEQKDLILRFLNLYRWRDRVNDAEPATNYSGFSGPLQKSDWGGANKNSTSHAKISPLGSPEVREVLHRIQSFLRAQGDSVMGDEEIYEMFREQI